MQYQVSPKSVYNAGLPHSFFILNLILVHLFASYTMLEIGYGKQVVYIPLVSLFVMSILWLRAQSIKKQNIDWFVTAHWLTMTKRIRLLLYFYGAALVLGGFTYLMVGMSPLKGGDVTTIALRMGAVPVFLGVLTTFVLSGGSIFDAQRGMVNQKIVDSFAPPDDIEIISHAEGAGSANAVDLKKEKND